jgi:formylglycine-generating enzyme required for sulfatase activity/tetratricopeptide (TPR) repeat protein
METGAGPGPEDLEEAVREYARRLDVGEAPDPDAYLAALPPTAASIRERILHLHAAHGVLAKFMEGPSMEPTGPAREAPPRPEPDPGLPFERLGEFRLLRGLGEGGMGIVYLAEQESLGRLVALKVVRPEWAGLPAVASRFAREAQAVARLRHPNLVTVFAAGEDRGVRWLAMELVPGRGLDEVLREVQPAGQGLPVAQALRWIAAIARALECAHANGIIHRDVKPSNIRITPEGRPLLLDFGLAREEGTARLTIPGDFGGTPLYASPEQIDPRGRTVDARADVYALGVTLYECVTGRVPFEGETAARVFAQVLEGTPPSPRRRNPSISRDLETVLLAAIEKDRERRTPTAQAFAEDLEALLELRPIRARPAGVVTRAVRWARRHRGAAAAVGIGLAGAAAVLAVLVGQERSARSAFRREVAAGELSWSRGDFEGAIAAYDRALGRRPDDAGALRRREELVAGRGRALARSAIEEARTQLDEYRRLESSLGPMRERVEKGRAAFEAAFMPLEERSAYFEDEEAFTAASRRKEEVYQGTLETLNRASRHDPESAALAAAYAGLFLEKWREAVEAGDEDAQASFRERVLRHDREGRARAEIEAEGTIALLGSPEGAAAHLFRYELQSKLRPGGERRLVPVPFRPGAGTELQASGGFHPGDVVLRVVSVQPGSPGEAAGIRADDFIAGITGVPIDGCVLVGTVDPAGRAARAGVRVFDRILRIAGREILELGDIDDAYADVPRGGPFEVVFGRGDSVTRVTVEKGALLFPDELGLWFGQPAGVLLAARRAEGARLRVVSGDATREVVLSGDAPTGVRADATAYPLRCSPANQVGRTPIRDLVLPPGSYLLVLRHEGHEELRLPFVVARGAHLELRAEMLPLGASPSGFVWIPPGPFLAGGDPEAPGSWPRGRREVGGFWIARREVVVREYLEFLNDPGVLREILAAEERGESIRIPQTSGTGGRWSRRDGKVVAPTDPRLPVTGVSFEDAAAFCAWVSDLTKARGGRWVYDLPTEEEWEKAARGVDGRRFPWGDFFDWSWCNGGRTAPRLAHSLYGMFARDASPWEVKDLTGSAAEWCRSEGGGPHCLRGGSWLKGEVRVFRAAQRTLSHPGAVSYQNGFRVVIRKRN